MGKQTEAYYQRIFEDAPIGMYRSTPDGKIVDANKALMDMLCYPDLESLKKVTVTDLFVDPKKRAEIISLHVKTDKISFFEYQLKRKDGKVISVRDTSSVIKDENGNPLYFEGVLEDITERVQAERELQKTRSRVETERAQRLLAETLRDIANLIAGTLEFDEVIQQIFRNLERLIPFYSAALILYQDEKLHIAAGHNIPNIEKLKSLEIDIADDTISRQIIETRQPLILNNPADFAYFKNYGQMEAIKSWLGVPLIARNEAIGLLSLDSEIANTYKEREMQIALTLASQIAAAIENARLFTAERRRADIMSALRATFTDITSELDLTTLLQAILERAVGLLSVTGGELALYNDSEDIITIAVCHNMDKDYTGKQLAPGIGAIGQVVQSGEPMVIDDYRTWNGHFDARPWRSVMVVPLMARDCILGAIALADSTVNRKFNQADVRLISLFAQQAAIAIENAQLFEEIQQLAETDDLTKINNRRQLFTLGEHEFSHAKRYQQPLSAIMLDIDNFKQINDAYGHAIGDVVLHALAQHCQSNIREVDILGRYGGEEFVILLPNTGLAQGRELAERLCIYTASTPISTRIGATSITISLGVAEIAPDIPNLAALIDRADTALYKAKRLGKNRVEVNSKRKDSQGASVCD